MTPDADIFEVSRCTASHDVHRIRSAFRRHVFPRHCHDHYVFKLVEVGTTRFWLDGTEYTATKGDVIIIPPYMVHDGRPGPRGLVASDVCLNPSLVKDLAGLEESDPDPHFTIIVQDSVIESALRAVHRNAGLSKTETAEECLCDVVNSLLQRHRIEHRARTPATRQPLLIEHAMAYLSTVENGSSLKPFALHANVSLYHLHRTFRRQIGMTPGAFAYSTRVSRAVMLLKQGLMPARVAFLAGFADQSHLTRRFKAQIGLSPGRFGREFGAG